MTILFIYIYIVQFLLIFIDTYHWLAFRCGQVSLCVGYSTWRGERCSVRGWPEFRWAESIPRSFTSQLPWQPDSFIKYNLHCFLSEPVNLPVTWTVDDLCALSTREEGRKRKRERERMRVYMRECVMCVCVCVQWLKKSAKANEIYVSIYIFALSGSEFLDYLERISKFTSLELF